MTQIDEFDVIIVGGGIAGVTCVESLLIIEPALKIALISATPCVKSTCNVVALGRLMQKFDVIEQDRSEFQRRFPSVKFIHGEVNKFDSSTKELHFYVQIQGNSCDHGILKYKKLCICTGGVPNMVLPKSNLVIGIRDIDSVETLQHKLRGASHIALLGNGGIANELVCEIESCKITWIIKDSYINSTFLDPGASQFLMSHLDSRKTKSQQKYVKRWQYETNHSTQMSSVFKIESGPALGPDWHKDLELNGVAESRNIEIQYSTAIKDIQEVPGATGGEPDASKLKITLANDKEVLCDFLVCATGVTPAVSKLFQNQDVKIALDGGVLVDESFETSIEDVFAAGDCCTPSWESSPFWLHMRLWTQAKQMGTCVARSMIASLNEEPKIPLDICFDVFTHVTTFFGFKVILLGNFNAKNLKKDECEILLRYTKGNEYVKIVLHQNRMCGAILLGETDYEETFENLIMNQFDLEFIKENLLDPDVDIEDYFD